MLKQSSPFFETICHQCGAMDEAKFTFAGPHIKQVCLHCGCYIKFFNKSSIPDSKDIKQKIWHIADGNIEVINKAKKQVEFLENLTGLNQKLMYWKLYLYLRVECNNQPQVK